ncbi:hypothetical protein PV10_00402 [Exophiala mesophila]|uniref:Mid2 domain-containing protein n=1 Tax=Exophiala mesophila TaxID=212818 RepID=A0A0D1ZPP4_EXOME|nr:uncharacterized protein PV10_00402 [Exophiala mesophila]KIV96552.1 hypothetical protein PV10_00402 [Exophiala mesophila]
MGSMILTLRHALWSLALVASLCRAQSSIPIATEPIVVSVTVPTTSLVTIYSVVTSAPPDAATPPAVSTVVTTINGRVTTLTVQATSTAAAPTEVIILRTDTIISTMTSDEVVMSTVGYNTIYGPAPIVTTSTPVPEPGAGASTQETSPPTTASAPAVPTDPTTTSDSNPGAASTSSTDSSSPSGTHDASLSNATSSSQSSSGGLSTGAKAGIGIGVAIGVIALLVLSFLFGLRYSRRRNSGQVAGTKHASEASLGEKDTFQAGQPYEFSGSPRQPTEDSVGKMHPHSFSTTEVGSSKGSTSKRSYEMSPSNMSNYHDASELSALPQFGKDDEPTYVGVPAHMSGTKRWSMKEYERH